MIGWGWDDRVDVVLRRLSVQVVRITLLNGEVLFLDAVTLVSTSGAAIPGRSRRPMTSDWRARC
jgi:hypothetical protein